VTGTIAVVHKLGDRWRAELSIAGRRVPIVGLAGARIPSTALVETRTASIVGIVRRASPGATDRRFAIEPRSVADIDLGPAAGGSGAAGRKAGAASAPKTPGIGTTPAGPADVNIAALEHRVGQTVRIGGLIVELTPDGARLDDGTATGRIVLTGSAAEYATLLEQGDAVNATGVVTRRGDELVVLVADAAGLARAGDLEPTAASPGGDPLSPSPTGAVASPGREARIAASAGPFGSLGIPGAAGLASLVLFSVISAVVTVLRRRRVRPAFLAALAPRLAIQRREDARQVAADNVEDPVGPPPM
jgi:hypothetical protein